MTEYLGRVNEATDEILSRKMIVSAAEFDGALRARRFGDSYALIKIAENIGLRDNLFDAFGGDGDYFLYQTKCLAPLHNFCPYLRCKLYYQLIFPACLLLTRYISAENATTTRPMMVIMVLNIPPVSPIGPSGIGNIRPISIIMTPTMAMPRTPMILPWPTAIEVERYISPPRTPCPSATVDSPHRSQNFAPCLSFSPHRLQNGPAMQPELAGRLISLCMAR